MLNNTIKKTLLTIARFYDRRMVGDVGPLGFRRSTDLKKLVTCLDELVRHQILIPRETLFLDMGCAWEGQRPSQLPRQGICGH